MQLITAIEPGSSGIPYEAVQGVEFANAEEAWQLIGHLGAYARHEAQKSAKGLSQEGHTAQELAHHLRGQVQDGVITDYPFSFQLRDPHLRRDGCRAYPERLAIGALMYRLAWHHGISVVRAV